MTRFHTAAAVAVVVLFGFQPDARAQGQAQGQDWFVPGQQRPPAAGPARPAAPSPAARPAVVPAGPMGMQQPGEMEQDQPPPPLQVQLPPAPEVPVLPKSTAPPTAVIGIISVPDIMHAASAAQQVERVVGQRRQQLNQDVQKEQAVWREMQQQLAGQRTSMTAEQIRAKERELQGRITDAQRKFRDRNRIIQEAVQYSLAQIERTLGSVVQQVAASHGMNVVLHRSQIALNMSDFDVSQEAVTQLNKVLPSVLIPPDGVSPSAIAPPLAAAPPPAAAPAAAPPSPAAAAAPPPAAAPAPAAAAPAAKPKR
jgi:Skp family chaperone for outer membrane proteins